MAFAIKDAKIIPMEGLFNISQARFYRFSAVTQIYKRAKLVNIGIQSIPEEEEEQSPEHYVSGYVVETTIPVNRKINLYRCDTGELVGSTTSSGIGGYFYCETTHSGSHYVVCLDNEIGADYNDLIYGKIFPATISG